jgi:hypothetical protein
MGTDLWETRKISRMAAIPKICGFSRLAGIPEFHHGVPIMKELPRFLIAAAAWGGIAQATPLTLVIDPGGTFDVDYTLSTGQSTSATLQISGDLAADVEISAGAISQFQFAGGNVAYSDTTSDVIVSTFPSSKVRILTRSIVSSATSNETAGAIDLITGIISNNGHKLVQDRGKVTTRQYLGNAVVQEQFRNLATQPDSNPMVGLTTVTASLLTALPHKATWQIQFEHARDESRQQSNAYGTLTIEENGGFTASGEVTVPGDDFEIWAVANRDQKPLTLEDFHAATGQPLVMLYAFDATTGPWSPPVVFDSGAGTMTITFPAGGLKAPVRLEHSPSLAAGSWATLEMDDSSPSIFAAGQAGTVTLDLPAGGAGFVRLALAD